MAGLADRIKDQIHAGRRGRSPIPDDVAVGIVSRMVTSIFGSPVAVALI